MTPTLRSSARSPLVALGSPARIATVTLLVATLLGLPSLASAQEESDRLRQPPAYLEIIAGPSFVPNQNLKDGAGTMSRIEMEPGFHVGAALGRRVFDHFRGEIQITYHEGTVNEVAPLVTTDGRISLLSLMFNAYYDLDLGLPIVPYLGAGLGWGQFQIDTQDPTSTLVDIDDTDDVFAYQFMVGATVPLTEVATVALGYRYARAEGIDRIDATIATANQNLEAEFDTHELTMGLRFHF